MQDILVYLFPFADIELKESLLLVNKELSKLRFNDFINDNVSQHILYNKGYINVDLYNRIQNNIKYIQRYNINFNINNNWLNICNYGIQNIDLTGLINLQELSLSDNGLRSIDLNELINLQYLNLSYNRLTLDCITYLKNLNIKTLYL